MALKIRRVGVSLQLGHGNGAGRGHGGLRLDVVLHQLLAHVGEVALLHPRELMREEGWEEAKRGGKGQEANEGGGGEREREGSALVNKREA